jgi:hypothetical protein
MQAIGSFWPASGNSSSALFGVTGVAGVTEAMEYWGIAVMELASREPSCIWGRQNLHWATLHVAYSVTPVTPVTPELLQVR